MHPWHKHMFVCIILALAGPGRPVFSEQPPGLTIDQAVAAALARNSEVLATKAEVDASRGRSLQLGARPDPQLTAGFEGVPLPGRDSGEKEVSLSIEQAIEFPGKRSLRARIGQYGVSLAEAELARTRLIVTARVRKTYWKAAYARSAVLALEKSSERLDLLLADLQAKYRSGAAAYADILRTRAEKARLRNQILEAENERRSAGLELNDLLARQVDAPVLLLSEMPFSPPAASLDEIQNTALASRPSQKIAALRGERAAAALKLAKASGRPDFLASFSLPSVRTDSWGVSFGLTLPFLRPKHGRGLALEAGAEAEIARLAAETQKRRILSALAAAYSAVKTAEQQVQVFERSLLRELQDELRIQIDYFRYGTADFRDLLDLQRTCVLAELDHLRSLFLFNIAMADLEAAGEELP